MKLKSKHLLIYFYIFVIIIMVYFTNLGIVFGQTSLNQKSKSKNSLLENSWSIQFQINNNFTLTSFQGSTISLKKHMSPNRAFRMGISLEGRYLNSDFDRPSSSPTEVIDNNQNISFDIQYTIYLHPEKRNTLFWGFGPTFQFSRKHRVQDRFTDQDNEIIRDKHTDKNFSTGILGMLGVEWFLTEKISLLSEYSSSLVYLKSSEKRTNERKSGSNSFEILVEQKINGKGVVLSSNSVKFGISQFR